MKVLIVKLSALGDVVQALPVAMAIRRQAPEVRLDWLVEEPSAPLLLGHPALDRVLVSPRHAVRADGVTAALPALGRFAGRLRAARYDWVLDLQGLMKSAIFVSLSRGRKKLGFRGGKEPLAAASYNVRLPAYDPDRHALERYLDVLEPMGFLRPAEPDFGLAPTEASLEAARSLMGGRRADRPLVLLHPVAKWESKLWPVEHWASLAGALAADGAQVALSGAPADRPVTEAIARRAGEGAVAWDLAGRTNLKELTALLCLADAVASTDTGVMHLAAALGRPVVSLFGPTAPWRTGPHGQEASALRLGLECSPCFRRTCPAPRCLDELGPDRVLEALWRRLPPGSGAGTARAMEKA